MNDVGWFYVPMSSNDDKQFSANLLSLQLQLKTMLEEAGGDHTLGLLDALCKLNRSEQEIILSVLTRTVTNIAKSDARFVGAADEELKEFEDNLYHDIVSAMREASQPERRLEVVKGGKQEISGGLIDFRAEVTKRRGRSSRTPTLN